MQSLIRLADLEVETLQKRLKDIGDRRFAIEMTLESLDLEAEEETANARLDAQAGWYLVGFREGWKIRRAKTAGELNACRIEEQGARDALFRAFEEQKKYETLAEQAQIKASKETQRRENAVLDELALRRTGTR